MGPGSSTGSVYLSTVHKALTYLEIGPMGIHYRCAQMLEMGVCYPWETKQVLEICPPQKDQTDSSEGPGVGLLYFRGPQEPFLEMKDIGNYKEHRMTKMNNLNT